MPFSNIFGVSFLFHLIIVLIELAIRGVYACLMVGVDATRYLATLKNGEAAAARKFRKTPSFFPNDNVMLIGDGVYRNR